MTSSWVGASRPAAAAATSSQMAVDRSLTVEQLNDAVGRRTETMQFARGAVVQHIPRLTPKALALDAGMRAQLRPQLGDAVPGRAEEGLGHAAVCPTSTYGSQVQICMRNQSLRRCVQIQA
jgi:hypothetical protein